MSNSVIVRLRGWGATVRNRQDWGTQHAGLYAERLRTKPVDFPVSYGFCHISVTSGDGDSGMRDIEAIGYDRFLSGVSYNWVIDHETHAVYEGQPMGAKGTHTVNDKNVAGYPYNLNYAGHAVAFMGMPGDTVCAECLELFALVFAAEQLEGVLKRGAEILPHSKFAAKDCPTSPIRDAIPAMGKRIAQIVRTGTPHSEKPKGVRPVDHAEADLKQAQRNAKKAGNTERVKQINEALKEVRDL